MKFISFGGLPFVCAGLLWGKVSGGWGFFLWRGGVGVVVFVADDGGDGLEDFAWAEVDEFYALGVAAGFADAGDAGAHHFAFVGDEHEFVVVANGEGTGNAAGAIGGFHGDDAFAAAALDAVFLEAGAFAEAVFPGDEEEAILVDDGRSDNIVAFFGANAPDANGVAAHVAAVFFVETDAHALVGDENNFVVAGGEFAIDETVALLDGDGDNAAFADVSKVAEFGFFDDPAASGKEDREFVGPRLGVGFLALDTNGGGDFFLGPEFEKIGDRAAFAGARAFGNLKNPLHVAASALGKENKVVVRGGGEEILDEVAVLFLFGLAGGHADHALAAAFLGAERAHERALDEAVVGEGDNDSLVGNKVFDGHLAFVGNDLGAAWSGVFALNFEEFVLDDGEDAFFLGKDVEEILDFFDEGVVFALDAVALEARELVEAEIENMGDLFFGEAVFAIDDAGSTADEDADLLDRLLGPTERHELEFGFLAVFGIADDFDERIEVGEGDKVAFELFASAFGLVEEVAGAAQDDFAAVVDKAGDGFLEGQELGLAAVDGQHVDAEEGFQRGVLVEVVDDDLRVAVALEFDNDAGVLGTFVADIADAWEDFFGDEAGDAFHEFGAVHVEGDLGNNNALAAAFSFLDGKPPAHTHRATAGLKIRADAGGALDETTGGKIGPPRVSHEPLDGNVGVVDLGANGVDALAEVVRGHVGGHADGDAGASIDEEVGEGGGKNRRFFAFFVVGGDKIDRAESHVHHERGAEVVEAGFGVTHGRWRVAIHRTEVSLALDERVAHRPVLGHVDEGGVDRLVAVGVVVAHGFADDLGAFHKRSRGLHAELVHGVEDSALGRLETVAGVGQGTGNNDGHRIVEEGFRHFLGDVHEFDFFVLCIHGLNG